MTNPNTGNDPTKRHTALTLTGRTMDEHAAEWNALAADRDRLHALINSPQTADFLSAVASETAHQVERWGTVGDRGKKPADWFWLVGYLAGKALAAHIGGDRDKALHHTISSAAALANWHAHITTGESAMQPGAHSDLQKSLEQKFGPDVAESRPVYRHVKTGGRYEILHVDAFVEATEQRVTVYRAVGGGPTWIRPTEEFLDGRFIPEDSGGSNG